VAKTGFRRTKGRLIREGSVSSYTNVGKRLAEGKGKTLNCVEKIAFGRPFGSTSIIKREFRDPAKKPWSPGNATWERRFREGKKLRRKKN